MDQSKRKRIEAAGWKVGDAEDFLELSHEERQLLDARVALARAIRQQRESLHMSQKQLGEKLKTSQPRVAKIERAASDVSFDQLVRALTAVGGTIVVKAGRAKTSPAKASTKKAAKPQSRSRKQKQLVLEVTTAK
jgi:transcriptional regulator with XRE-family HTH domain